MAVLDPLAQGVRSARRGCAGTSYGQEARASHQVTASAPAARSPPPPPVPVLPRPPPAGVHRAQREPRLSPGSLSPERSPSLSVTAVCAFFFFFFPPRSSPFLPPLLPLSRLVTELGPIAASPAGTGWPLIGRLGARSRLPLLRWSEADKRRRLWARATATSQSRAAPAALPSSLRPPPARVLGAPAPGVRPAPGPYHSEGGRGGRVGG